jgi:3-oxoadipate enol-lactonase
MQFQSMGISLSYTDTGPASRLPVVFIHGFPFSKAMWDAQRDALSPRYRVITYDQRGHGETSAGNGQFPLEFLVDDLLALFDHLKLTGAVLCGLSMGGYVALRFAERHPDLLRGLVLCDTRAEADSNEAKLKRAAALKTIQTAGLEAFAEGFVKSVFAPETAQRRPDVVEGIKKIILQNPVLGVGGTLLALAGRTDTTAALSSIRIPALVLVGEKDAITPPAAAEVIAGGLPNAQLHVIPGAGHLSNLENPLVFNERLTAFLGELR